MTAPVNPNLPIQPSGPPRLGDDLAFWRRSEIAWLAIAALAAVHLTALRLEGHRWWCKCGQWNLWSGDTRSFHNSQHLFDPYSLSHISHGILFCGLCAWLLPKARFAWWLVAAMAIEVAWEILENTPFVINRYRAATISLDYYGDSVANSFGDVLSCFCGFLIARYLGLWRSIVLLVVLEMVLLFWIRDNLLLNVVMLIHPVDAIRAWQSGY
jgi:Protein of unknown function (DUF2585)